MARLLDLPTELLHQIFNHVRDELKSTPKDESVEWRKKHVYDLSAVTMVNKKLHDRHDVVVPLVWRTVDRYGIDVLFKILGEGEDFAIPVLQSGQLTPRQTRFQRYVDSVHSIEMDQLYFGNRWDDIQHSFEPLTADAKVADWRASQYFPHLESGTSSAAFLPL